MAGSGAAFCTIPGNEGRTSALAPASRDRKCYFLPVARRVPVAVSAARFFTARGGECLILSLARGEFGRETPPRIARKSPPASRSFSYSHCPHPRFAIGEDGRKKGGCYGYDAGKKIAGRKRFAVVDTQGLIVALDVLPADIPERAGAEAVLAMACEQSPTAQVVWADGGYGGEKFTKWCLQTLSLALLIVKKPLGIKTFLLLPRRWVVERTFGWLRKFRRLSRDYEEKPKNSKGWIFVAMIQLMVKRLGRE